jgi:aromatic-L-amino-acid/L-tryptophan decarboxylase
VAPHLPPEESLDPADWESFRALGHRMLDDMVTYLRTVRERKVWQAVPEEVRARLDEPVPWDPAPLETVYDQFTRDILPYPTGNIHPRFWGWVLGTGTPVGMLAELLASAMNPLVSGHDQGAAVLERRVIAWLAELLGFPPGTSGLLVSGASEANLLGLAVGRNARAGFDVRAEGLHGSGHQALMIYASEQTHGWITKACDLLGIGRRGLRWIPVAPDHTIRLEALARAVCEDRAAGRRPCCVVGNAGTVNVGATDDLAALAGFCHDEGLWFHVDGAFGALAALAPALAPAARGLERADSIGFDLHKWGYVPYEAGVILVRDEAAHRATFGERQSYLHDAGRGVARQPLYFADLGVQLSRGFRALKIWMSLKTQGAASWGRVIEQNVRQARHLADQVRRHEELELLAPVPLNIVCLRYRLPGLSDTELDGLNQAILIELQERGIAVPSSTRIDGRFAIRVAITNHRSRLEDFDLLVRSVVAIGRELAGVTTSAG